MAVTHAAARLYTNPPREAVTTGMIGRWSIDFAPLLDPGVTIETVSATVTRTLPLPEMTISGFVTDVAFVGETVYVGWTGAALTPGQEYLLKTRVVLSTGDVPVRLTYVEVPT